MPDTFLDRIELPDGTILKIKGVPEGGTTDQILAKASEAEGDVKWINQQDLSPYATKAEVQEIAGDIPDVSGFATTESVTSGLALKANISDVYNKSEVDNLLDDKADVSAIPDVSNFVTSTQLQDGLASKQDTGDYALKSELPAVPTNISAFTNDSNYITEDVLNSKGYLTEHQDISGKADKATTLSGYGITDAYTKSEIDSMIGDVESILDAILGA